MREDYILLYAIIITGGLILFEGLDHGVEKRRADSLQSAYAREKAFLNNQETNQTFSETAEDKFLKEKTLQVENKRKVPEEKANEIRKASEEHLDSLEKINNEENNALKKNMPTHQNAQTVVKGCLVKPCQLIIKQKENVRV